MEKIFIFGVLTLTYFITLTVSQEIDCTKIPPTLAEDIGTCCKEPESDPVMIECAKKNKLPVVGTKINNSATDLDANLCFFDCIHKDSGMLSTDLKVNQVKIKEHFTKYYPNDKEYANSMIDSLEKCTPFVPKLIEEYKKNSNVAEAIAKFKCPLNAFELTKCAVQKFFVNCPTKLWTATPNCDQSKKFAAKCALTF